MNIAKKAKSFVSDFWLGKDFSLPDMGGTGTLEGQFDNNIVALASARRAVGNFVSILTNQDIPVAFEEMNGAPGMTDGKKVIISADITTKEDFDWGVGLALHEGSHIVLSDMNLFATLYKRTPQSIITLAEQKGIVRDQITMFCKFMFNYIEDRYIDTYVYDTAPGYRGYYTALYNKFFHSAEVSKALKSKGWRIPTLASYEMRIINMTNPHTDPKALPALQDIFDLIEVKNIRRLKTTKDRLDLAFKIVEKVLENIDKEAQSKSNSGSKSTVQKIVDIIGQKGQQTASGDEDTDYIDNMGDSGLTKEDIEKIIKALQKQRDFLQGKITKKQITAEEKAILDVIEEAGVHVVQIQNKLLGNGVPKIDCVLVKRLTKALLDSGAVPMCNASANRFSSNGFATADMTSVVNRGIILGTMLGRKLAIRREENNTKYTRRPHGKIDRRILAGIGAGLEDIFYNIHSTKYGKANLHITVDASGSMSDMDKWGPTMTCVVAICKAASMIPNLRISVSFRSTSGDRPYIVMAYDSAVDKFDKVKLLFPYLVPSGGTPEGLAMEATIKSFLERTTDDADSSFFLNLSDGEPCFQSQGISYAGDVAVNHTKSIVDKLRTKGFYILSYFISNGGGDYYRSDFQRMYGKDAKFIDVTNVCSIAKTMNDLFLKKNA